MMESVEPDTENLTRGTREATAPAHEAKPTLLDYQSPAGKYHPGFALPGRLLSAAFCLLFAVWGCDIWRVTSRGWFYVGDLLQPSVLLSVAGSVLCLLVALGVVGHRDGGSR
jgi:hypothetical protein